MLAQGPSALPSLAQLLDAFAPSASSQALARLMATPPPSRDSSVDTLSFDVPLPAGTRALDAPAGTPLAPRNLSTVDAVTDTTHSRVSAFSDVKLSAKEATVASWRRSGPLALMAAAIFAVTLLPRLHN